MTSNGSDNIDAAGRGVAPSELAKLDIDSLQARDVITMETEDGVSYRILVGMNHRCVFLASDDPPPALEVIIKGGTNADTSEYTPNRVYAGGRLAYAFSETDQALHTTPVITKLSWDRAPV